MKGQDRREYGMPRSVRCTEVKRNASRKGILITQRRKDNMPENEPHKIYEKGKLYEIELNDLKPNPDQPRKVFYDESLGELRDSIEEGGVQQPIRFRQEDGKLFIVFGHRRVEAAKKAGQSTISAIFFEGSAEEAALSALTENIQREDLSQVELAEALKHCMDEFACDQKEIAEKIGKAESTVSEIFKINGLSQEIRDEFRGNRKISRNDLLIIAKKKDPEAVRKAFEKFKAEQKAGKKSRKVRPWPVRIISGCEKINSVMRTTDIGPLDVETRKAVIKHLEELKEETETLLNSLKQVTTREEGDGSDQDQPQG